MKYFLTVLVVGFTVVVVTSLEQSEYSILATSPSFSGQTQNPTSTDHHTRCLSGKYVANPITMELASINSDGKTLNATLWFVHCKNPKINGSQGFLSYFNLLQYGMKIYVAYPYKRASYDVYIRNENNTRWISRVIENNPNSKSEYRPLSRDDHVISSFKNDNNYAHLSLNLNTIGSPETYKVSFYTANKSGTVQDITNRALVPPLPGLNSTWPSPSLSISPIRIQPGQSISIPIRITSTNGIRWYAQKFEEPIYLNLTSHGNVKGVNVRINPDTRIQIPPQGEVTTNLLLSALPNIQNVNLSIPAVGYFYNPYDPGLHIKITPKFNVEVMQPIKPSLLEDIRSALIQNISIAVFIPLIITTLVVIVLSRFTDLDIFKHLKEGVTAGDLLAMDGAVIAGVLILLTIQHASAQATSETIPKTLLTGVTTASIIIPFSLSAIRTATHGLDRRGIQLINTGFIYLIVAVILLGVIATPE